MFAKYSIKVDYCAIRSGDKAVAFIHNQSTAFYIFTRSGNSYSKVNSPSMTDRISYV